MAFAAVEKKGRSRYDSPAPRSVGVAPMSCDPGCKDDSPAPEPSLFAAAFLVAVSLFVAGLGHMKMLFNAKKPLGDSPTWIALFAFLGIGTVVMRYDVHDIAMQETKKEGSKSASVKLRTNESWMWPLLATLLALVVGVMFSGLAEGPACLPHPKPASLQTVQVAASSTPWSQQMFEDLILRSSTKTKNDIENVYGRYLDASLVLGADQSAAHRSARDEAAGVVARQPSACIKVTTASRWHTSVQWSDEAAIFLLSALLMIGIAASRYDFAQLFKEQQEHAEAEHFAADSYPSAEKCFKGSQARGQWRLYACVGLLLAVVASAVATLVEDN